MLAAVKEIKTSIVKKQWAPIYFLSGDEPFYIDALSKQISESVLEPAQREFNQWILYGRDTSVETLIGMAKRYPMMADYQVIIIKEAQDLSRTIEQLAEYAEKPQPTTILVFCYKYKTLDGRKKLAKQIKAHGKYLETKPLYDDKVPGWIQQYVYEKGQKIAPKAAQMLFDFLGNDLSKIAKELEKLDIVSKVSTEITPELIEAHIGISKDYNSFEFQKAISSFQKEKAFTIAAYFAENAKTNPLVVTLGTLFRFFTKLMRYHALPNKSQAASVLGVHAFFVKEYSQAATYFSLKSCTAILNKIREIDAKNKGVNSLASEAELLKELLVFIFNVKVK